MICTFLFLIATLAIVEQVRDGSNLRVRLLLPNNTHQFINICLAGVRCPRASTKQGEPSEQYGEEVRLVTRVANLIETPFDCPISRQNFSLNLVFSKGSFMYKFYLSSHPALPLSKPVPIPPPPQLSSSEMVRRKTSS